MTEKVSHTLKAIRALEKDVAVLKTDVADIRHDLRETHRAVERLYDRQVQGEIRLSTEIVAVASLVREVRDHLLDRDRK